MTSGVDFMREVRKVNGHNECSLSTTEDLVHFFINEGYFVYFRRKFRKILMLSPSNPECKMLLKSTAEIQKEELRHLCHYYHMIHPFSPVRMNWEVRIVIYV